MRPDVKYTTYATSPKEKTGYIITFAQLEEGNLFYKTHDDAGSGDKPDNDSIMSPLISEE